MQCHSHKYRDGHNPSSDLAKYMPVFFMPDYLSLSCGGGDNGVVRSIHNRQYKVVQKSQMRIQAARKKKTAKPRKKKKK
jgi:hypothetical protein